MKAFALSGSVCAALLLTACGNWISVTDAGQVGVTVGADGRPVVAVVTCDRLRPWITLSEGRKKTDPDEKPNVQRGSWRSRHAFSGVRLLDLSAPSDRWKAVQSPGLLEADRLFIVDGAAVDDEDASLGGVSFRLSDLAALTPDDVLVNDKTESLEAFGGYRCS